MTDFGPYAFAINNAINGGSKKEEKTEEPTSANGFGVYTQLKNAQEQAGYSGYAGLIPKPTINTNKTRITPYSGISVNTSNEYGAGNYQNITALNASQRRLLRKNGGLYVGRNGQVYTIGPGTSRTEMRKAINQQRKDLLEYKKLRGLGLVDEANDVFKAYSDNPSASYIRYNPEGFKLKLQTQQSGESATPSSSYRYSFSGGLNANKGIGNLYLQLVNGMNLEDLAKYATNGVLNNDSMIKYITEVGGIQGFNGSNFTTDNMNSLNTKLGTKYTYTPDETTQVQPSGNSWTGTISGDELNEDRLKKWAAFVAKVLADPSILDQIPISKKGGKMNKFQYGGAVNKQQVAQEQAVAQQQQLTEIFQAIAQKPKETLMALQKQGVQPKLIIDLAQKMADKNPAAKAALQALSQMQQMAKEGAKLQYIKRLRGQCPEGYELKMFKAGGKMCSKCEKIKEEKKGGQVKGDESDVVKEFKSKRCGGKMKK